MVQPKKKEITSIFRSLVKRRVSRLFNAYKEDKENYLNQWINTTVEFIAKNHTWDKYLTDEGKAQWLTSVPNVVDTVSTERELEDLIEDRLIPYVCFVCSVFEVDHYFSTCEKMYGWLPLHVGSKTVGFAEKMFNLLPFDKFLSITTRKMMPIFTQLDVMLESISRNIDEERIQADIAESIVTTATVAARIPTLNALSI